LKHAASVEFDDNDAGKAMQYAPLEFCVHMLAKNPTKFAESCSAASNGGRHTPMELGLAYTH